MIRCTSLEKIKSKICEWKNQINKNHQNYKIFYNFVFDHLREEKKVLRKILLYIYFLLNFF